MITIRGKAISGGMGRGRAYLAPCREQTAEKAGEPRTRDERQRLKQAVRAASESFALRASRAEDAAEGELLSFYRMMLEDEDFLAALREAVDGGAAAEDAVRRAENVFSEMLLATGDDYMAARADDVRGVCAALMTSLSGGAEAEVPSEPFVLVAKELLPDALLKLKGKTLAGAVLGSGSYGSHTAILLREMGIPALISEDLGGIEAGMDALIDAARGTAFFAPDETIKAEFDRALARQKTENGRAKRISCPLYVNAASADDARSEASGVGLLRTEFLYMNRNDLPDEEEQFSAYRAVLRAARGKPVIARTFDLGADKQAAALPIEPEPNPALGRRGLRVYQLYPEAFQTQLRALLRAAALGDLRIMYPMITSCEELRALRRQAELAAETLSSRREAFRVPMQGVMIETPAAVIMARELAAEADFFSVGTNDLAQYTYALDRQGSAACAPRDDHAALLRMTAIAVEAAHKAGITVGICGELAADPDMAERFAAMGADYLSVSPSALRRFSNI